MSLVVAVREEVAQAELLELLRAQVRLEPEHAAEVVRADLDARLADLEGRLAHRMLALLEHQHADVRRLDLQLPRQRQARRGRRP